MKSGFIQLIYCIALQTIFISCNKSTDVLRCKNHGDCSNVNIHDSRIIYDSIGNINYVYNYSRECSCIDSATSDGDFYGHLYYSGTVTKYNPNGSIQFNGKIKYGLKEGVFKYFTPNGLTYKKVYYKNDTIVRTKYILF